MRIIYISGDIGVEIGGRKGAATHVRETCHALQRFGHEVTLVTPTPGELSHVYVPVVQVKPPRARWLGSDLRYIGLNRRIRTRLVQLIKDIKPHAVYERYSLYQTAGQRVCRGFNMPRILEVNTLLAREQRDRLHWPGIAQHVENSLWRREGAIICVSETLKRLMIESARLDEKKMTGFVISPVAVDADIFHPSVEPAEEVRRLAKGRKVAGYAGTLTAWHGVDLFFHAARYFRDHNVPCTILAVGGEDERVERLRARASEEKLEQHLNFYGSIPHHRVPSFLAAMDVCLIADTQDWSSPTKFFEFAAMEKPIVAARSPSVNEVFGHNEQAGLFFERGDGNGMAQRIIECLENPEAAKVRGAAARERVLERYTWECNVRAIMQLYEKMGADTSTTIEARQPECGTANAAPSAGALAG
ncbi:MAG: glycosyltransferase family 4 protein [Candidatus Sumerlaeaceae bacterium]